jgi:hypothetical protein
MGEDLRTGSRSMNPTEQPVVQEIFQDYTLSLDGIDGRLGSVFGLLRISTET